LPQENPVKSDRVTYIQKVNQLIELEHQMLQKNLVKDEVKLPQQLE
jgi:hypothetical protein